MTAYESLMSELKGMRTHFDTGFSTIERQRIIELYKRICDKEIVNITCADCYKDAFAEIFTSLQRLGCLPEERHYKLIEGKCLHIFGTGEYLFDVTDEQAEKHLAQFPNAIEYFAKYPADWQERVEKRNVRKTSVAKRRARKEVEQANKATEDEL